MDNDFGEMIIYRIYPNFSETDIFPKIKALFDLCI